MPMNGMTAWHLMPGIAAAEQIILTHWAIRDIFSNFAVMLMIEFFINAHATVVTVLEVFSSSDAAQATILAVIRFRF
jgi:hypothetical protein